MRRLEAEAAALNYRVRRLHARFYRNRELREKHAREREALAALDGPRPRCGARCRSKGGAPCGAPVVVRIVGLADGRRVRVVARRCRIHGGLSTGARTPEGRERLREAGRRGAIERWRRWREAGVSGVSGTAMRARVKGSES
jgi:hypothetical protein